MDAMAVEGQRRITEQQHIAGHDLAAPGGSGTGGTLQGFLAQLTDGLGKLLKLRIQLSSFDAMCRMTGAGVEVDIVPQSAARSNQNAMDISLIELTDALERARV